ncbi:hypothetical protein ARMGADRAFT_1171465 [Armillaria gallica]|uniref:Uncharacterized protein n=1 Tax=Armillaria gallica TaxID=47427 RepID=A0A2H3CE47_ARMGA|nr:hypothetical protein ARMGADRAFT_1171465 [Armillaria gallica]
MPPSEKRPAQRTTPYQVNRRKVSRRMRPPEASELPSTDETLGGGIMLRYKNGNGKVYNETLIPRDQEAVGRKWLPLIIPWLYGGINVDYDGLMRMVQGCKRSWEAPKPKDDALFRTFYFTPSLQIRVWNPNVFYPGKIVRAFGLDFVNSLGEPQSVHTVVKIEAGPRIPGSVEKEGDVLKALDDLGVQAFDFDKIPSRYAVGREYTFTLGKDSRTYTFSQDLLALTRPGSHP